jgi:uncharacterized protein (DUF2132 family)
MKTLMAKSPFLCLAYQTQVGGGADCGRLEAVETEVLCLCEELEASQRSENKFLHREAQARSQVKALMSQVARLKDVAAAQELEITLAGASREMTEQGRQRLEAECRRLRSACSDESSSTLHRASALLSCLVMSRCSFP